MNARPFAVTILAALLAVLTLAPSAWAGCTWVLWMTLDPASGSGYMPRDTRRKSGDARREAPSLGSSASPTPWTRERRRAARHDQLRGTGFLRLLPPDRVTPFMERERPSHAACGSTPASVSDHTPRNAR